MIKSIESNKFDHLEHIDQWLAAFGIEHEDIGIIIGPEVSESQDAVKITYSVRVLDDSYSGRHEIDGSYTFSDLETEIILKELYPQIVEQFEDKFPEAEIQSYKYTDVHE